MSETAGDYHIYRYDFPDGSAYVGRTKQYLPARHHMHLTQPNNSYLLFQLRRYPDVLPEIISSHTTLSAADRAEKKALAELTKPLNAVWLSTTRFVPDGYTGRQKPNSKAAKRLLGRRLDTGEVKRHNRKYPRRQTGEVRCWMCQQRKPASEYHTSQHRSSGLSSKCRQCAAYIQQRKYEDTKLGMTTAESYKKAVEDVKEGRVDTSEIKVERGRKGSKRVNIAGEVKCLWCCRWQSKDRFNRRYQTQSPEALDVYSYCKDCQAELDREIRHSKQRGEKTSEGYRRGKAMAITKYLQLNEAE